LALVKDTWKSISEGAYEKSFTTLLRLVVPRDLDSQLIFTEEGWARIFQNHAILRVVVVKSLLKWKKWLSFVTSRVKSLGRFLRWFIKIKFKNFMCGKTAKNNQIKTKRRVFKTKFRSVSPCKFKIYL
jgi:hypothetical protein